MELITIQSHIYIEGECTPSTGITIGVATRPVIIH